MTAHDGGTGTEAHPCAAQHEPSRCSHDGQELDQAPRSDVSDLHSRARWRSGGARSKALDSSTLGSFAALTKQGAPAASSCHLRAATFRDRSAR